MKYAVALLVLLALGFAGLCLGGVELKVEQGTTLHAYDAPGSEANLVCHYFSFKHFARVHYFYHSHTQRVQGQLGCPWVHRPDDTEAVKLEDYY